MRAPFLTPAWVSKEKQKRIEVKLFYTPQDKAEMLFDALRMRTLPAFSQQDNQAYADIFQKLAWLQEYCRVQRIPQLRIETPDGDSVFDLTELIGASKKCFACSSAGSFVACARCSIACWCSEGCLRESYGDHMCAEGAAMKDFFSL
jgi:hypothetical protein